MLSEDGQDSDSETCLIFAWLASFISWATPPWAIRKSCVSAFAKRYLVIADAGRRTSLLRKHTDSNYGFRKGKLVVSDFTNSYTQRAAKITHEKITLRLMLHD